MISGRFGLNFLVPMPVVRVDIHLPDITADFASVDFLLDTGSVSTCLHPDDARFRLGIEPAVLADPTRWPDRRVIRGVGGTSNYYACEAVYVFHDDHGSVARQITSTIDVAQPTASNGSIPSLLGMDILRHFRVNMDYVGQRLVLW